MEETAQLIFDEGESEVTIIKDVDLNTLLNLTYNFDILKNTIFTIFKNQENLLKKITKIYEINNEQNKLIESLEKKIQEKYISKDEYNETKNNLESQIKALNLKISQIDEEFIKSN